MNKKQIGAVLVSLSLSTLAFATTANATEVSDQVQLEQSMDELVVAETSRLMIEEGDAYHTEFISIVATQFSEIYITEAQAEELSLQKSKHFYLSAEHDLETLTQVISNKIEADEPTYFSVSLFREYNRNNGGYQFGAKITEYEDSVNR
ncbi:hypothetical protein L2735_17800 [Shewanella olleyana]|uniref:hypothetical protein n=1 Tax=Shewanella olleyana TaxID=135626 RepID=UPI00200E66CE|nr:hypothetical protein [Shewanella olleyana]MCL1068628.1 hypothetical protein [Shewanella olleyana]